MQTLLIFPFFISWSVFLFFLSSSLFTKMWFLRERCPQCQAITVREIYYQTVFVSFWGFFCQIVLMYQLWLVFFISSVLYMNSHLEVFLCCCCCLKTGYNIISEFKFFVIFFNHITPFTLIFLCFRPERKTRVHHLWKVGWISNAHVISFHLYFPSCLLLALFSLM